MDLITISEASKVSGIPETTIRYKIDENVIAKYTNDKNVTVVNKREVLEKLTPTVLTLFNQKGGCGKTSLSVMLGDYYEKKGVKTLLVDFDPQRSLSKTYFEYHDLKNMANLFHYFQGKTKIHRIPQRYSEYIDVMLNYTSVDNLYSEQVLEMMKKYKDDFKSIFKNYQVVIIDCPPAKSALSMFGILISNYILMPFIPEPYNYDGIVEAKQTIDDLWEWAKDLIDYRVIVTIHEQRKLSVHEHYIDEIKEDTGGKVFENTIPNFVGIKERGGAFENLFDTYKIFEQKNKADQKIVDLCDEIYSFIYDQRPSKVRS